MRLGNRELRVAAIVAMGLIGCSGHDVSEELVGEVSQDWSVESCDDAEPNAVYQGIITSLESPSSYNKCHKSYVVDVDDVTPPDDGGSTRGVIISWANSSPLTPQWACEKSWVGGILYRWESDAWEAQTGQVRAYGQSSGTQCLERFVVLWPLEAGEKYRVAATARNQSDDTRSVLIEMY